MIRHRMVHTNNNSISSSWKPVNLIVNSSVPFFGYILMNNQSAVFSALSRL